MRVQKNFEQPSLTKQSFKNECDINQIIRRYIDTGGLSAQNLQGYASGEYGDFSDIPDYRSALDQVRRAGEAFDTLPAVVRERFQNNVAGFLDFCNDPSNLDELRALGLARPVAPVTPQDVSPEV